MSLKKYLLNRRKNSSNRYQMFLSDILSALNNCGLLSYNTPETDKVGRTSYDSVIAQDVVGDGASNITHEDINLGKEYDLIYKFNFDVLGTQALSGNKTDTNIWCVVDSNTQLRHQLSAGNVVTLTSDIDISNKLVEIKRNGLSVELRVDGVQKDVKSFSVDEDFITSSIMVIGVTAFEFKNNLALLEYKTPTESIKLINEERQSDGITLLKKYDAQGNFIENIMGEQFFSPAIPTVDNNFRRSEANEKGVSIARGLSDNLFNLNASTKINASDTFNILASTVEIARGVGTPKQGGLKYIIYLEKNNEYTVNVEVISGVGGGSPIGIELSDMDDNRIFRTTYTSNGVKTRVINANEVPYTGLYIFEINSDAIGALITLNKEIMLSKGIVPLPYVSWQGYYIDEALQYPYHQKFP